jgi:Sigma-70, region 4
LKTPNYLEIGARYMATQKQVAEHLGISQGRVSQLIRRGILPPADRGDFSISTMRCCYEAWQEHLYQCRCLGVPNSEALVYWYERKIYAALYGEG